MSVSDAAISPISFYLCGWMPLIGSIRELTGHRPRIVSVQLIRSDFEPLSALDPTSKVYGVVSDM